jgi:hypothetical protein
LRLSRPECSNRDHVLAVQNNQSTEDSKHAYQGT